MLLTGELAILLRATTSWNVTGEYTRRSSLLLPPVAPPLLLLLCAVCTTSSRLLLLLLLVILVLTAGSRVVMRLVASNKDFRLSPAPGIGPIISRLFSNGMGSSWVRPLRSSSQYVFMQPLPLTSSSPRSSTLYLGPSRALVDCDMCTFMPILVDSMREAVFTESPNRQYLGILSPTIPATTAPE